MKHSIDITHLFTASMPVYPGDPPASLEHAAVIGKDGFYDFRLTTGMHVGTHMDGPLHMIANGKKLSEFPPEKFFGRGVLVDARGQRTELGVELLDGIDIQKGNIVLIMTGFSKYYRDDQKKYFEDSPVLTPELAQNLIEKGVSIVGMDIGSPDRSPFAVHKLLLRHDILIIENLTNLEQLMGVKSFEVVALPAKFDADSAPTRTVAVIS